MSLPATESQETPTIRPKQKFGLEHNRIANPQDMHWPLVTDVIHLPGGQRIMTSSRDGSLRVWNLESGKQIGEDWRDGESEVLSVALSLDGEKVVSVCVDDSVRLWDVDTGKVITKWTGHTSSVTSVCWNRDGGRVVSGSYDGTARVWDVESGETILAIKTGTGPVSRIIYSPDTMMIATGVDAGFIKIWDSKTGRRVANLRGHTQEVSCLAWTPDGKMLISGSWDASIRTWNTTTWEQINVLIGHGVGFVNGIALSPNGRILASAANVVQLWNLENGQLIAVPLEHASAVACVSFSTDGKLLATGCWDKNAYTWDVSTIVINAGLGELLSNPQASTSQKPSSKSLLVADDATRRPIQPIKHTRGILPQSFFDDKQDRIHSSPPRPLRRSSPSASPSSESRQALFTNFFSLFRRSHASVREATAHNKPSSFTPLRWTPALFSGPQRPDIELEQRPSEVEVPCTRGLARNTKVGRKSEKKAPIPNNIMTINVTATSPPPIQVQQSSSQPQVLFTTSPAVVTSTTQHASGAAHTQQSPQPQALLNTTTHAAATAPVTGTALHPDIVIRQPGLWTRFRLFLCCVSTQFADNHN